MDVDPPAQIIQIDKESQRHLEQLAQNVTIATGNKTGVLEIQAISEQQPLNSEGQNLVQNFEDESNRKEDEKELKLSHIIDAWQKKGGTTKAINFLGKKLEWLNKKSGGEVKLK